MMGRYAFPLIVAVIAVVFALSGQETALWLRYDRAAILDGEYWRLITANLAHLGWPHLLLNLFGLGLIWAFFGPLASSRTWLAVGLGAALATSLGLLVMAPDVGWYVGLSGALHGLFVAGALLDVRSRPREALILLAAVAAKLVWEQIAGPLPGSEETAGGPVLVDSHLYGALGGLALGSILLIRKRFSSLSDAEAVSTKEKDPAR